jgi:hypothetical protein
MRRNRKVFPACFVALALILCLLAVLPSVAYAGEMDGAIPDDGDIEIPIPGPGEPGETLLRGTCGENLTWVMNKAGTLTISGTGSMTDWGEDETAHSPWYGSSAVKRVIIKDAVTSIGDYAFAHCENLTKVSIPSSLVYIGDGAFAGCEILTDVQYAGSRIQWQKIAISEGNESLDAATIQYAVSYNGWIFENGKWYYYRNNVKQTGWVLDKHIWYYMNTDGIMQTGWVKVGSAWYYLASSGAMQTGWLRLGTTWYYLASSGAMQTGWLRQGSTWYYLASSGAMATGWQKVGTTWYYFRSDGAMATGWLKLGSTWYYLRSSGAMATGSVKIGAKTYRFNQAGACLNP